MKDIESVDVRDHVKDLKEMCDRDELRGLMAFVFDGRETFLLVGGTHEDESLRKWFRIMHGGFREALEAAVGIACE
jgi:hypothetical protein